MRLVDTIENGGALVANGLGGAVVDVGGVCRPGPEWRCWSLYQAKNVWQCTWAASIEENRLGRSGRYFSVLNWASPHGLSSETCGRLCDWVMPRSASRDAAGLEVIEEPRPARIVNWSLPMPCLVQVWRISTSARAADSRLATIQPVTYREKMSKITYR